MIFPFTPLGVGEIFQLNAGLEAPPAVSQGSVDNELMGPDRAMSQRPGSHVEPGQAPTQPDGMDRGEAEARQQPRRTRNGSTRAHKPGMDGRHVTAELQPRPGLQTVRTSLVPAPAAFPAYMAPEPGLGQVARIPVAAGSQPGDHAAGK